MKNLYEFPNFRELIDKTIFSRIDKAVKENDTIGAFIFMACAIDYLASFWFGDSTKNKVKEAYTGFIDKYFPTGKYNSVELYICLRNGLLHAFTINGGIYILTSDKSNLHLKKTKAGQVLLDSGGFNVDLIQAKESYFNDVVNVPELMNKFYQRYDRDGFLRQIQ